MADLGPHSKVAGREEREHEAGVVFLGIEGGGLGFHRLTLYW